MIFPLIIGHRGCKYPNIRENSCRAVEQSIREGADIVELDVVYSKENHFIGYHPWAFQLKPFLTINNIDSFESLLKTLDNRVDIYVDIKGNLSAEKMKELLKLIKKYHNKQVIIGSFYVQVLKYFRKAEPSWIINYHCLPLRRNIQKAMDIGANWINPVSYGITRGFVAEAIQKGLKFVPAGNENHRKQLYYAKLGAYALSTFRPASFRKWLAQHL